jgi:L-threonylcarbamoyladenylate synthase
MMEKTFGVVEISPTVVKNVVEVLKKCGVIVYPTDTIYGLGGDATEQSVIEVIRKIKKRDGNKPFLVLVSDLEMLEKYARVTDLARRLIQDFKETPLTILLEVQEDALQYVQNEDGYVAFRIPSSTFCVNLVRGLKKPLISTSANISNTKYSMSIFGIIEQWRNSGVNLFIQSDVEMLTQQPSTIVDVRNDKVSLVREGVVSLQLLKPYM